jgi:tetraacyldisaccharide 4'-kinase
VYLETEHEMVYSPQRMHRVLSPFSLAHQVGCWINNLLYDLRLRKSYKAPLPVISVGNIAFGGSEKTPLVINLLSFCLKNSIRPTLVTRGYKGKWEKTGGTLSDGRQILASWKEAGDEPFMVSQRFPQVGIYVGRNRLVSCKKAFREHFDVAILDDGFQHRMLQRDLDIVLYTPGKKTALREFFSSLKRADIILVKQNDDVLTKRKMKGNFSQAKVLNYTVRNQGFYSSEDRNPYPVELLKQKRLLVLSGIARPKRFLSLLEKEGLIPASVLQFPDHHSYPPTSIKKISREIQKIEADAVLTTEKDYFKLKDLQKEQNIPVFYNRIELEVDKEFYPEILLSLKSS